MSQAGYTPIQLYYSTTAAATPSAGNLAAGELAVNITDGKLFYKDNGGVVRVLATAAGSAGDVVGPGSSTDNALVRFDGTTGKLVQNSAGVLDDSGNLTGIAALTTSGALTLNGGTANGVAYLNGSKVLTTGSALTFDGTTFSLSGGAITSTDSAGNARSKFEVFTNGQTNNQITLGQGFSSPTDNVGYLYNRANAAFVFGVNDAEQMRLTSTGLGIGTSSPTAKLDVRGNATFTGNGTSRQTADFTNTGGQLYVGAESSAGGAVFVGSSAYAGVVGTNTNTPLQLGTNGTIKATLDSSGNLGLGVTPSAWGSGYKAFEFGSGGSSLFGGTSAAAQTYLTANAYFNGTSWIYKNTAIASYYEQSGGKHTWYTAPSGTAGNAISFTQAMTLDASGRLLVGTTTAQGQLTISNLSGSIGLTAYTSGGSVAEHTYSNTPGVQIDSYQSVFGSPYTKTTDIVANADSGAASQLRLFTTSAGSAPAERARIDSSGNLLVGTTSAHSFQTRFNLRSAGTTVWGVGPTTSTSTFYVVNTPGTGVYLSDGATSWAAQSDERVKDIIEPIADASNKVSSLRAVIGKYKSDKEGTRRSFLIAQDVQAVLPEAVHVENDEIGTLGVRYTDTIPLLVAAIQEQQALITALTARVAALEAA